MEAELSEKQKTILQQFKKNVGDIMRSDFDDHYLMRWLRAKEWDSTKAEKMLRKHLEWRKTNNIDSILDWEIPEVLRKYVPGGHFGVDKEGFPIEYQIINGADFKGMHFSSTKEDLQKYKFYAAEHMTKRVYPELSKQFNKRIDQTVLIFDFDGVGIKNYWKPAFDATIELIRILEVNYPDRLRACYIINAPGVFSIVWKIVKPLLSELTASRVQVFGKNWKPFVLKKIDAAELPVHWGGTATDPDGDPCCKSKICMGGPIPEKYYRKNVMMESVDLSQFTVTSVGRGASLQLEYPINVKKSILSWNFWTDNKDIGFGVYRRTADEKQELDEMDEIIPAARVDSHMIPETGIIECERLGTYVIVFDNTYSWVNSKKVSYLVNVAVPDSTVQLPNADSTQL